MGRKSYTTNDFIKIASLIHRNKYSYSKTNYVHSKIKVIVTCKEHGDFYQLPAIHINGQGCRTCAGRNTTNEQFIEKAKKIHGDKYDYSLVDYKKAKEKVKIICQKHGIFEQVADKHLQGSGCRNCANYKLQNERIMSCETFIKRANKIHKGFYSYENINYEGIKSKINIKCRLHGNFLQTPMKHLEGQGCRKCSKSISKPEIEIQNFIKELGFKIESNNRVLLNGKELDIYIPKLNKAIEFNGYYWHYNEKNFVKGRHSMKSIMCKEIGINLLHLREDLWIRNKEKMKNVIKTFLMI